MSQQESKIVEQIVAFHRKRCFVMETRKRADLALGAALRLWLGWRRDLEKAESDRIKTLAKNLIECAEKLIKGKSHPLSDSPDWLDHGEVILAAVESRKPTDKLEKQYTDDMERLAKSLPVWSDFAEHVRGFGAVSLAVIIGETGDLSNYSTHSKLWKRMGVAVLDGVRQGGLRKTSSKELWIAHGYKPVRRARLFVIGDVLIKTNGDGPYRSAYLARKQYERDRAVSNGLTVAPAAKIPKARSDEFMSDGQVHLRAQRYMEKRLLRDLWKAWRRAETILADKLDQAVPAAEISVAPKGARGGQTQYAPSAIQTLPPPRSRNAPAGAEKTIAKLPEKAVIAVSSRKSRVASKDAGKAISQTPAKAAPTLPSRKSRKAA